MMAIEVNNISKVIGGVTVLDDMNLTFEPGKIYGLKGKNGSGKTMLMRAICGLIRPTQGSISINGSVLGKDISFPDSIGVLIENPSFINKYTGFKNLKILASIQNRIDDSEIRNALKMVGLEPDDKRTYRKYSLGMKQRLGIACALMEYPEIILLDEPFNALDDAGIALVREILLERREQGCLLVLACHETEELEALSDEVYRIVDGKIVDRRILRD